MIMDRREISDSNAYDFIYHTVEELIKNKITYQEIDSPFFNVTMYLQDTGSGPLSERNIKLNAYMNGNVYHYEGNILGVICAMSTDYDQQLRSARTVCKILIKDLYRLRATGKDYTSVFRAGMKIKDFIKQMEETLVFADIIETHQPALMDGEFFLEYGMYALETGVDSGRMINKFERDYII
jgi:hypothetical protein